MSIKNNDSTIKISVYGTSALNKENESRVSPL